MQTDKPLSVLFHALRRHQDGRAGLQATSPARSCKVFTDYTRTHNQAVFDAYTPEMKAARHTHIITAARPHREATTAAWL